MKMALTVEKTRELRFKIHNLDLTIESEMQVYKEARLEFVKANEGFKNASYSDPLNSDVIIVGV